MSEEIKIDNKKISLDSSIKLSVKTAFGIVSALWVLAGIGYFDLKNDNKIKQEKWESEKQELFEKINTKLDNRFQTIDNDIKFMIREQENIKGDIKVIIDRTKRYNPGSSNDILLAPPQR